MVKTRQQRQQELMNDTLSRLYERLFEHRHALRVAFAAKANKVRSLFVFGLHDCFDSFSFCHL